MTFDFSEINFWAILVCAVATFMVGGLWYGLVFAKTWVTAHGFSDDQVASMAGKQGRNFAIFFATDLVMATVISLLALNLGIATDTDKLSTFILTVMEGAVMQARAHKSLDPFDASVAMLRDYFDRILDAEPE